MKGKIWWVVGDNNKRNVKGLRYDIGQVIYI